MTATCLVGGCAGHPWQLNPFYVGQVPAEDRADSLSLGPLWDDRYDAVSRESALHPLWRHVQTLREERVQVLHPLINWRRTDELTEARLVFLWWYRNYHPAHQPREWDFFGSPLFFAGGGPPGERYFALFPVAGKIRDFIGFDEFSFLLFPLYYQVRKVVETVETFHNITPLIGWVDGGPRDGSWRVLPLYAHSRWEGKYDKYSVLWPFFHYHRARQDMPDPSTLVALWPLFKIDRSDRHSFKTFLWPFFRFNRERPPPAEGSEGPGEEYFHTDILWPLYRRQHTREFDRVRLFPFFSRFRSDELSSDAFMIPLLWRRQERQVDFTKDSFHLVPILHREHTRFHDGRGSADGLRIWPLFAYESSPEQGTTMEVPALLPFAVKRFTQDFHDNWFPWFLLYRSQEKPDGSHRVQALFRLIDYSASPEHAHWSVPLVYSGSRRDGRTTHDLLLGLIRVSTGEGGLGLRLLFLPLLSPSRDPR